MQKILVFALCIFFVACKPATNTDPNTATTTTTTPATNGTAAPSPTPAAIPAALSKYELIKMPYTLESGLMEGDLDQNGWTQGAEKLIATPDNAYAILRCSFIGDAEIRFELQTIDASGKSVGELQEITYFQAMADAASVMVNAATLKLDGSTLIISTESTYEDNTNTSETKMLITPTGVKVAK